MDHNKFVRKYWVTSVGDDKFLGFESRESAQDRLKTLLRMGWYLFAENTPGRKRMTPGDQLCFYLKRIGVAAHAELGEPVKYPPRELNEFIRAKFNCPFRVHSSHIYFDNPVALDLELRCTLDAFNERNPKHWQWFVQMTHEVTARDFALITRAKAEGVNPIVK